MDGNNTPGEAYDSNSNKSHNGPSSNTELSSIVSPSPLPSPALQKIWGGNYSLRARAAMLYWAQRRRDTSREAMVQEILDLICPADREDALRYAQIEADFQVKQSKTTMELEYLKWKWDMSDRAVAEISQRVASAPDRDKTKPRDSGCAWGGVNTVTSPTDGTGTKSKHEDDADPDAADKWGPPPQYGWGATETTAGDSEVAQEDEPRAHEKQGLENDEERWGDEYDDDPTQAVLEAFPESLFDGQREPEPVHCSGWQVFDLSDDDDDDEAKPHDNTSNASEVSEKLTVDSDAKNATAREHPASTEETDEYPGADEDNRFLSWPGHAPSRSTKKKQDDGSNSKLQNHETDKIPTQQTTPSLPTPPPSPRPSSPSPTPQMTFDQAWKRLARILTDAQWRDYIQSWYRGTHALKTRDLYRGRLLWAHLSNRPDAIREAELRIRRSRHPTASRTTYAVVPRQAAAGPSSSSSFDGQQKKSADRDDGPEDSCPCHADQGSSSTTSTTSTTEIRAAECPYNRRRRRVMMPQDCPCGRAQCEVGHSSLRKSFTMRELLLMEEAIEIDPGIIDLS